ncbi:MAG: DNA repair protein RecO [Alphaproteobacteria bacterium]
MTNWVTQGVIVGAKNHGEKNALVFIFTADHGLRAGIFRNAQASKNRSILQMGNRVDAAWKARLQEHLGEWKLEVLQQVFSFILDDRLKLIMLEEICNLIHKILPEGHPYPNLYVQFVTFLERLKTPQFLEAYVKFEIEFLKEMGFGLDFTKCAVTNVQQGLTHVSPNTGRAVCASVAEPYEKKLLKLPPFLHENAPCTMQDLKDGLVLTGYFLEKHFKTDKLTMVFEQRDQLTVLLNDRKY